MSNQDESKVFAYNSDSVTTSIVDFGFSMITNEKQLGETKAYHARLLKAIDFNPKTDSLYFIYSGWVLVYSTPSLDLSEVARWHDMTGYAEAEEEQDPEKKQEMKSWKSYDASLDPVRYMENAIYTFAYADPEIHLWLRKDVYKDGDRYINFVYPFQNDYNAKISFMRPRVWFSLSPDYSKLVTMPLFGHRRNRAMIYISIRNWLLMNEYRKP
jgi:hypothetical protein